MNLNGFTQINNTDALPLNVWEFQLQEVLKEIGEIKGTVNDHDKEQVKSICIIFKPEVRACVAGVCLVS